MIRERDRGGAEWAVEVCELAMEGYASRSRLDTGTGTGTGSRRSKVVVRF